MSTLVLCSSLTRFLVSSSINSWTTFLAASNVSSKFHLRLLDNLALKSATASHVTLIALSPPGYSLETALPINLEKRHLRQNVVHVMVKA